MLETVKRQINAVVCATVVFQYTSSAVVFHVAAKVLRPLSPKLSGASEYLSDVALITASCAAQGAINPEEWQQSEAFRKDVFKSCSALSLRK